MQAFNKPSHIKLSAKLHYRSSFGYWRSKQHIMVIANDDDYDNGDINIGEVVITAFRCLQGSTISVAGKE
jgi:hypothetical protein